MKILVISPYPPGLRAASMRLYQEARHISKKHKVTLFLVLDKKEKQENACEKCWNELFVSRRNGKKRKNLIMRSLLSKKPYPVHAYENSRIKKQIYRIVENSSFDAVFIASPYVAAGLNLKKIRKHSKTIVIDINESDNVLWRSYSRHGTFAQKIFANLQLVKTRKLEKKLCKNSDLMLFVSEKEKRLTEKNTGQGRKLYVLPNGVEPEYFSPKNKKPKKNSILFCGALDVRRNADAIIWFAEKAFPVIRRGIPDAQLNIVGARASRQVKELGRLPGVNFIGEVKDIRDAYSDNAVLAAPYKFGGGTRLKVLECLSMQVPIIATPAGVQGINVKGLSSVLVGKNEKELGEQAVYLLENYEKIKKGAPKGRKLVQENYSWKGLVGKFVSELEELARARS